MTNIRIALLVTAIVVVFIFIALGQELTRRYHVQQQIEELQQEVTDLEREADFVRNLNHYYATDEYQERLAREKLNYAAPGEKVVLIPEEVAQEIEAVQFGVGDDEGDASDSILRQWWLTFFPAEGA